MISNTFITFIKNCEQGYFSAHSELTRQDLNLELIPYKDPQEPSAIALCGFNSSLLDKEVDCDGSEAWLRVVKENVMTMLKHTHLT